MDIAMRSLDIMMQYDRYKALLAYSHMIDLVDAMPGIDAEFHWVSIPDELTIPTDLAQLADTELANSVVEAGRRIGADPTSWREDLPRSWFPEDALEEAQLTEEAP